MSIMALALGSVLRRFIASLVTGLLAATPVRDNTPLVANLEPVPYGGSRRDWGWGYLCGSVAARYAGKPVKPTIEMRGARYGSIWFEDEPTRRIDIVAFKSVADGEWDRLVVDQDVNRDLSNDPVLVLDSPDKGVDLNLKTGDKPVAYVVTRQKGREPWFRFTVKTWMKGTLTIDHETLPVFLLENWHDGRYWMGDILWIGGNDDGRDCKPQSSITLGKYIHYQHRFYVPGVAPDGTKLTLTPYAGPMGRVCFCGSGIEAFQGGELDFSAGVTGLAAPSRHSGFSCEVDVQELPCSFALPADAYLDVMCCLGKDSDRLWVELQLGDREIADGQELTFQLDKPQMQITVGQRGDRIQIDQTIAGPAGTTYRRILRNSNPRYYTRGPDIVVMRADDSKEALATGTMKYG